VVESEPAASLVVIEAEFTLELFVVAFDAPTHLREVRRPNNPPVERMSRAPRQPGRRFNAKRQ
jgi:hypothetical protein